MTDDTASAPIQIEVGVLLADIAWPSEDGTI